MTDHVQTGLLDFFVRRYAILKAKLAHRLGDDDLANDALHDAYVRLHGMDALPDRTESDGYLMRVAINLAVDKLRHDRRFVSGEDVEEAMRSVVDESPGPERTVQARVDLGIMMRHIGSMPDRRQAILTMTFSEGLTREEIARHLKVSVRTVDTELRRIHERMAQLFDESRK